MTHRTAALAGVTLLATLLIVAARPGPARAEHMTLVPPTERTVTPSDLLDLDLKLGADGFRLGARFFGAAGVWGAWLNGQSRPDGFALDGRVQRPERGDNFKMNAEIDAWARRALEPFARP